MIGVKVGVFQTRYTSNPIHERTVRSEKTKSMIQSLVTFMILCHSDPDAERSKVEGEESQRVARDPSSLAKLETQDDGAQLQ